MPLEASALLALQHTERRRRCTRMMRLCSVQAYKLQCLLKGDRTPGADGNRFYL